MKIHWPTVATAALLAAPLRLLSQSSAQPALPPVATVLERLVERSEHQSNNDGAFNQQYGYTGTKVIEYRNSKGAVKKREEKSSRIIPSTHPAAAKPPAVAPQAESIRAGPGSRSVTETNSTGRGRAFERKDFSLNDDLLGRFQFAVSGREWLNGRPALVLDFKPADKKLPERSLKDKFINKTAGRLWVDEADYVLARADLRLIDPVNVVGGLVGAVRNFKYHFDRERTSDGLWFTRAVDWHLEAREVVVHREVDYHEEKADVRKAW